MPRELELYRHFNSNGELLYVGRSLNAVARQVSHKNKAEWWDEVSRIEIERFPNEVDVRAAERSAVETENPKFNVHWGKRAPRKRSEPMPEPRTPEALEIAEWLKGAGVHASRLGSLSCANPKAVRSIYNGTATINTVSQVLAYIRKTKPAMTPERIERYHELMTIDPAMSQGDILKDLQRKEFGKLSISRSTLSKWTNEQRRLEELATMDEEQ